MRTGVEAAWRRFSSVLSSSLKNSWLSCRQQHGLISRMLRVAYSKACCASDPEQRLYGSQ